MKKADDSDEHRVNVALEVVKSHKTIFVSPVTIEAAEKVLYRYLTGDKTQEKQK